MVTYIGIRPHLREDLIIACTPFFYLTLAIFVIHSLQGIMIEFLHYLMLCAYKEYLTMIANASNYIYDKFNTFKLTYELYFIFLVCTMQ